MARDSKPRIEAAGGVLWRTRDGLGGGVEVALIHRPQYDDWSLPKGKLDPGEHPLLAALREVGEETGFTARPGRYLVETRYAAKGVPKRVRYWALQSRSGGFRPNREVDRLDWVPVQEAAARLAADHDRPVLLAFAEDATPTWPVLLVRHASAGQRRQWTGPDTERPLDDRGRAQAAALVPLLHAYGVERVLSADVRRCRETVIPFARSAGLTVGDAPWASEHGYSNDPGSAGQRLLDVLAEGTPTVVSTQGGVVDGLVTVACATLGMPPPENPSLRKGAMWVLHAASGEGSHRVRLAAADRFDPPPVVDG